MVQPKSDPHVQSLPSTKLSHLKKTHIDKCLIWHSDSLLGACASAACNPGSETTGVKNSLVFSSQDLRIDNPDAEHLLSHFLGRVIVDEVLPPKFLTAVLPFLENKSLGVDIVQATGDNLFCQPHPLSWLKSIAIQHAFPQWNTCNSKLSGKKESSI